MSEQDTPLQTETPFMMWYEELNVRRIGGNVSPKQQVPQKVVLASASMVTSFELLGERA
jgi:hypothetical protein